VTDNPAIEPIIEPDLPIVDAHHHLWFRSAEALAAGEGDSLLSKALAPTMRKYARYLFDDFLADLTSGHNVRASVFIDAHAMYRADGPEPMKSVGEVEFVNGVAAMSASGAFGEVRACAGIIGGVDLAMGDSAKAVLEAQAVAGGDRYRGIRTVTLYDEDAQIMGGGGSPHVLLDETFRAGFRHLAALGLSFDAMVFGPQLPDVIDLARSFPDTQIILNHFGGPLAIGRHAAQREERIASWRESIRTLAQCPNVAVKLGGIGMAFLGFAPAASSAELAELWRPYVEVCIEAFGADRCMFESNYPVDAAAAPYPVLWNAYKRLAAGASAEEKAALFAGTATRIYRLDLPKVENAALEPAE
jgi:predicted TIM-barrel fold metal-dependent hydrolase